MNRRFNPLLALPLWAKLLIGILVALALLFVPTFFLVRAGIYEIGVQNARAYVAENGARQLSAVSNAISQSRTALDDFTANDANLRLMTGLLLGRVRSALDLRYSDVAVADIEDLFRRTLLNPATTPFENVRLLDREGRVLARVALGGAIPATGLDESGTLTFQAVRAALEQGQTRVLSVSMGVEPEIDYVNAIPWRDGRVLGYVVARFNNARTIYNNLRFGDTTFSAYSFLITQRNEIIAPDTRTAALAGLRNADIVASVAQGQAGTEVYNLTDGTQVIGYYTPVRGTPFSLLVEVPVAVAYNRALEIFNLPILILAAIGLALAITFVVILTRAVAPALDRLRRVVRGIGEGDYNLTVTDRGRGDEVGALADAVVFAQENVRVRVADLEARLASRARDIAATQDISRFAATQRDLQVLMDSVVDLIVERFPIIYHAQIFLLDNDGAYAVVRASTGEVGRRLLERGHRLAVGSVSVIGQVTETGRVVVARDTSTSPVHRRNEFLPETRAELAIPLKFGDTVIGALDVQSKLRDAFNEDLINVLQTMADQIAIAIQNARLYAEAQERAAVVDEINRRATQRAWEEFMRDRRREALIEEAGYPVPTEMSDLRRRAIASREIAIGEETPRNTVPVAVPIALRGEVLGAVEWEIPAQGFGEDKLELARELANRLAISLDNARLFSDSRRAAERERVVNTIAAKLIAQSTIDDILHTAVREVGQALKVPNVAIRLRGSSLTPLQEDEESQNGHSNGYTTNGAHADHDAPR